MYWPMLLIGSAGRHLWQQHGLSMETTLALVAPAEIDVAFGRVACAREFREKREDIRHRVLY